MLPNFQLRSVSTGFVLDSLNRLKPNKTIASDKLSARLLKDASDVASLLITELINKSFMGRVFPKVWKSAYVLLAWIVGTAVHV